MGIGVLFFSMICVSGCVEVLQVDNNEDETVLSLRVDEVFQKKAYVRLNHDGNQEDYWYYVLTQDLQVDAETYLNDQLKRVVEADGEIIGNTGTNKSIAIENLQPKTTYRVIAARLLPTGKITGKVAELTFVTLRDPAVFEVHPSWSVDYKGPRADSKNPNIDNEVFGCSVGESAEPYVVCVLLKSDFENYFKGDERACFEDYIAYRNSEHVKWKNVVLTEDCEHLEDRLMSGWYIAFMIGVDTNGELTGYYAQQVFERQPDKRTKEYENWIGEWLLKGKCDGNDVVYDVRIEPDEINLYLKMYGWEGASATDYYSWVPKKFPIRLYFERTTGKVYVMSEMFGQSGDQLFDELILHHFYLYGCVQMDYQGTMMDVPVDIEGCRIARLEMTSDKRAVARPEKFEYVGEEYDFVYFNYSYMIPSLSSSLVPVTTDMRVPRIDTIVLEKK